MDKLKLLAVLVLLGATSPANAERFEATLPSSSTWYFQADFDEMRSTEAGRKLYGWLDGEIFAEIRQKSGFDPDKEADRITAFSGKSDGTVILLEGNISRTSQDKLLALAALADTLDTFELKGKTYYFVRGESESEDGHVNIDIEDGAYFSFAVKNKLIATSTKEQMEEMLASGGRLIPRDNKSGTLFVLTAEKSFVQAGMNAEDFEDGFDSNILKNAERVAVMIADVAGKIAVEARLVAKEAEMAESLASIVRGLISLQAFNDEMDPELSRMLQTTRVDVDGTTLKISVALDPDTVVAVLEE